jgi:hypothetical protein
VPHRLLVLNLLPALRLLLPEPLLLLLLPQLQKERNSFVEYFYKPVPIHRDGFF